MALNSMLAEADYRGVDAAASGAEVVFRSGLPRFGPGQGGCTVYSRNGIDPKPPSRVGPGTHIGLDGRHNRAVKKLSKSDMALAERRTTPFPLPEHQVDQSFSAEDDFDRNWIKGVRSRATSGECSSHAPRMQKFSWEPERKGGAGPGAFEVQASEQALDTKFARSRGAVGLGVSTSERFLPSTEDLEQYSNPAPGLYGEGGVPRNPEWEWKKDLAQLPRGLQRTASFVDHESYVPTGLTAHNKYRYYRRAPCDYWTSSVESMYASKNFNSKGTANLLSPKRPSPDSSLSHLKANPGPGQYHNARRENRRWTMPGSGRGGFGAGFVRNNDRFPAYLRGKRSRSEPESVTRRRVAAAEASDLEQSMMMTKEMGFDPGKSRQDFEHSIANLNLSL